MIIVSLTTIPERLEKGLPGICIDSIMRQTIMPDYIIVNIPEISKSGKQYSYELAQKLEQTYKDKVFFQIKKPVVKVQFGIKDLGPVTKIVPTLDFIEKEVDKDVDKDIYIILVDDDCIYNTNMVESLVMTKKKNPHELVIGTSGRLKQKNRFEFVGANGSKTSDHIYVDIMETFPGSFYDYALFKDKINEFRKWLSTMPEFVMLADDIILSFWAKKQGVKLYKIHQQVPTIIKHDPKKTPELNLQNDCGGNNDRVYDYFEDRMGNEKNRERIDKLITESANNSFANFVAQSVNS
jgi:hypothetical protein